MRDIVSCFSENAIDVSHPSCSSFSHNACISPGLTPSVQNAVSCFYKIILSTQKQLLATVSWSKNHTNQGLSIKFGNDPSTSFKLGTHTRFFRKLKGNKLIESDTSKIEVFWDLSSAKYELGPEPVEWFYVLVMVDSEIGLVLGDIGEETLIKKFKTSSTSVAKVSLISRQEHCSGNTIYATKAQFCETGIQHDIVIKCSGETDGLKHPVLSVYIDKKTVIRDKKWNG
ncbi:hypothetical protein NC651_023063 [Populus alba x Populus x berolinensis]|nr:hypothetical protein NC651_023063 [Populus alba x Populus x berolinensis]